MAMQKTERLKLNIFPQNEEDVLLVRDVLRAIADSSTLSNMQIIDAAYTEIERAIQSKIVWDVDQPDNQNVGDVWNEIISA